jgi:hypothetical protein
MHCLVEIERTRRQIFVQFSNTECSEILSAVWEFLNMCRRSEGMDHFKSELQWDTNNPKTGKDGITYFH